MSMGKPSGASRNTLHLRSAGSPRLSALGGDDDGEFVLADLFWPGVGDAACGSS
eukprot:CAMPEP_0205945560 /NCGR_PEP_ID=MMETSP1325-20131115/66469_1 /ASSEMBLY_ACC=CAM_ASM_000708 /TAXON_ID=236786 /ORGANISM="Florenciella sp., Strain RCC1007" /LENGTH=53 /DNA_ID=CAMNT_0053316553 /DNA_START=128 /DNA_END=286 /DNA_ORIENTATION=-